MKNNHSLHLISRKWFWIAGLVILAVSMTLTGCSQAGAVVQFESAL